jgi:hypothetical protein
MSDALSVRNVPRREKMRRIEHLLQTKLISITTVALLLLSAGGGALAQDEEAGKHALHELAGPFIVFRPKLQEELKLSDVQNQKMQETLPGYIEDATKFIKRLQDMPAREREKAIHSYREKASEKFTAFLKEVLSADQLSRLKQLQLQHEGPAALGRPEIRKELKITDEQMMQFMGVIQDMQKKIEPLIKEAQSGGNPEEIRPKVIKIRKEREAKMESFLSDEQRTQWKAMLGKPVDVLSD